MSLFTTWQALTARRHRPIWWMTSGLTIGLGLLSKQTMVAFPALLLVFMLFQRDCRPALKSPWPYLSFIIAASCLIPTLIWNMDHGWITLLHTKHHFDPNRSGGLEGLKTFLELLGSLFGVLTPLTFCLIMAAIFWAVKNMKRLDMGERYLFCLGPLPIILVLLLALNQKVNPNWPAPFFITSTVLAAHWGLNHARRFTRAAALVGATMVGLLYLSVYISPLMPTHGGKFDPYSRLRGWKELGKHVSGISRDLEYPEKVKYILAFPRQVVSELAFYMDGQPRVYMWKDRSSIKSQYDLWKSPFSTDRAFTALLVKPDWKGLKPSQIYLFKTIKPVKHIKLHGLPPKKRGYWIYVGKYDPGTR